MKKIILNNADELAIDDAFRSLEKLGEVELLESYKFLESALNHLEKTGFAGITILPLSSNEHKCIISGFKGKHGPCYDTGNKVEYNGLAKAALDDDHHLLIKGKTLPVCEKTYKLLTLPIYGHVIKPAKAESDINDETRYFSYDKVEEDHEKLFNDLPDKQDTGKRTPLFYPGPFKSLILSDGTIVRRGKITRVPFSMVRELKKTDRLFESDKMPVSKAEYFQQKYRKQGILWVYEDRPEENKIENAKIDPDWLKLGGISKKMKDRLGDMIHEEKDYFLLTGSDPSDRLGCCPSEEVGEANQLVNAGILSSLSQVDHRNSCPVTTYAFRNEIHEENKNHVRFIQNMDFRNRILNSISQKKAGRSMKIIRWALLIFIILSLFYGLFNTIKRINYTDQHNLIEVLSPIEEEKTYVLLFHFSKRCLQCRNMENYTRELLREEYLAELSENKLEFRLIDMDKPEYQELTEQFGFITAAMVIVKFENKQIENIRVLDTAWTLYNDQADYQNLIRSEIDNFLTGKNE